jgi:N-succinyldiaminopimelate aminotransferase
MANTPPLATRLGRIGRSVYSQLVHRLKHHKGPIYPLHVGDTYLAPASYIQDLPKDPHLSRYSQVRGDPAILDTVAAYLSKQQNHPVHSDELILTHGATEGLTALLASLISEGDEVLILAPYWPLVAGSVRLFGGVAKEVPFFLENFTLDEALNTLEDAYSSKTKVIYLNTPNNPTGKVLEASWVKALVRWAEEKEIWLISDEVYDLYSYTQPHTYARPYSSSSVISAFSLSKAFGMAGYRCGFLQGPPQVIDAVERAQTYLAYNAPTPSQYVSQNVLGSKGLEWAKKASKMYYQTGCEVARLLDVDPPQGSTFLFIDIKDDLKGRSIQEILGECVDQGLLLAPGSSFGPYPTHIRICFTSAPHD